MPGFYDILIDRLKDNGFSDQRLIDAVNNAIDNCQYPTPTINQFISFDKNERLYSYLEVCNAVNDGDKMCNYEIVEINENKYWIKK